MTDIQTAGGDAAKANGKAPAPAKPTKYAKLDRSQDFGTIWSATGHHKAAFFQKGRHYDAQGDRIVLDGDKENEAVSDAIEKKRRTEHASRLRAQAAAVEAGEDPDAVTGDEEADGVNLALWGSGQAKYRFGAVREAIQARFSRSLHTEHEAREFLVEQGVITSSDLKKAGLAVRRADKTR